MGLKSESVLMSVSCNVNVHCQSLQTDENSTVSVLPACTGVMTNLCGDDQVRRKLVEREETWEACCVALVSLFRT